MCDPFLASLRSSSSRGLPSGLVAKLAPQDLADVGFRQLGAELDLTRALVACQVRPAMGEQRLSGEFLILADNEQFYRLARLRVGHTDRRALQHARMHDDDRFDLVRIHDESGDVNHDILVIIGATDYVL